MQCKPKVIVNDHVVRGGVAIHRAIVDGPLEDGRIPELGGHRVEADRAEELVRELRELMRPVSFLEHYFPELRILRVRERLDALQDRAPLLRPQVPFERQPNIHTRSAAIIILKSTEQEGRYRVTRPEASGVLLTQLVANVSVQLTEERLQSLPVACHHAVESFHLHDSE